MSDEAILAELACEALGHPLEVYSETWNGVDVYGNSERGPADSAAWKCACGAYERPAPIGLLFP